jgi:hypothetical protein
MNVLKKDPKSILDSILQPSWYKSFLKRSQYQPPGLGLYECSKSTQYQDHADMNFFLSTQYQDQAAMFKSRAKPWPIDACGWLVHN